MEDGGTMLENGKIIYNRTDSVVDATVIMDSNEDKP